jgi:dTDP-4-dehydrorhamnose reductase
MKILLLGAEGQLGRRLRDALPSLGSVVALGRQGAPGLCGDLADREGLAKTVRSLRPDVIVNAAAYTAVDRAESEPELAFAVNAHACEVLAREAADLGAWLVHYSTDYVFDGSGDAPWREGDEPWPLNVYGRTKLEGERAIQRTHGRHLILRTSWVFDSIGENFLKAILRAAQSRDSLQVVDDQWGSPTSAQLLASVTTSLLSQLDDTRAGLYHLAAGGETNRLGMARRALQQAAALGMPLRAQARDVHGVATSSMRAAAARPLNSRLATDRLKSSFAVELQPWEHGVDTTVEQLVTNVATLK